MAEARPAILAGFARSGGVLGTALRVLALVGVLAGHWWLLLTIPDRRDYNPLHPYTGWIPIAAFILLRNATPDLRASHSTTLALMGRHSLEFYLLQFHVWLGASAKVGGALCARLHDARLGTTCPSHRPRATPPHPIHHRPTLSSCPPCAHFPRRA